MCRANREDRFVSDSEQFEELRLHIGVLYATAAVHPDDLRLRVFFEVPDPRQTLQEEMAVMLQYPACKDAGLIAELGRGARLGQTEHLPSTSMQQKAGQRHIACDQATLPAFGALRYGEHIARLV